MERKLGRFQQICGTIRRNLKNKATRTTLLKFYKTVAVPVLTYGSEIWSLTETDKRKIETSEMRFLRSVAGLSLRSVDIKNDLHIYRYNLNERIKSNKINWYHHVQRMDENRLSKIILQYKPQGRRDIRRKTTTTLER